MLPKLLELHFSQLQSEWSVSKYNSYSDLRKQDYHGNLEKIISYLEKEDFSALDDTQINQRFYVIFFVFKSLEFLNHSTTSTIPFELVFVLELALKDWSPSDEYLIVTSLINGMNEFSFDNSLTFFDLVYQEIELLCGVKFKNRLVQINLPESTSRDYLANVVLYHELGHFVEKKYAITRVIYIELIAAIKAGLDGVEFDDLLKYFPYLKQQELVEWFDNNYSSQNLFAMHISEYFCDLFASQYIKDCSNYYLEYITLNQGDYSNTHPSTVNRIIFINEHLSNRPGYTLNQFTRIIKNITGIEVSYKAQDFTSDSFEKLIPVAINESKELHALFIYGWQTWLGDWDKIRNGAGVEFELSNSNVYEIINNLIEKSIGNYIITNEWKLGKN
jgi:hypothetical protein